MRNPERIDKILQELGVVWKKYPDWRLGQLIVNTVGRDPFFVEDYDFLEYLYVKFNKDEKIDYDNLPEYFIGDNTWC